MKGSVYFFRRCPDADIRKPTETHLRAGGSGEFPLLLSDHHSVDLS